MHQRKYIPQLDGLRGIAILMVICFHYFPWFHVFDFCWTGVDLFFVLSGFLITGRLLPYLDDKRILQKFYRNRFLRIVPVYIGFLIVFFLCWFFLTSKETQQSAGFYKDHWWQFFLFIQNWVFIIDYSTQTTYLAHLWSIAIEEQFYLLFPFFLLLIRGPKKLMVTALLLLLALLMARCVYYGWFLHSGENDKIYWNTFLRLDPLLVGLVLYLLFRENKISSAIHSYIKYISWIAIVLLIGGIVFYRQAKIDNPFLVTFGFSLIAVMYGYLVYLTLRTKKGLINSITSNIFLRYTGRISYGMYIIHWPLLFLGLTALDKLNTGLGEGSLQLLNAAFCIPLTYLLSYLSFTYFESYFLKHKVS